MMSHPATPQGVEFVTAGWAGRIAADLKTARESAILTALSILPPRPSQPSDLAAMIAEARAAAARGVAVIVVVPAPTKAHPATGRNASTARDLIADGVTVRLLNPANLLHAKTCTIDGRIAWVGSGNYTHAAATHNHEAWLRTTNPGAAYAIAKWQRALADQSSRPTPEQL